MRAVAIEVSGRGVRSGIVTGGRSEVDHIRHEIYALRRREGPASKTSVPNEVRIAAVLRSLDALLDSVQDIGAVGLASHGVIDTGVGTVIEDPSPGYNGTNWPQIFHRHLGRGDLRYYVENDAKAAAWGEYLFWGTDRPAPGRGRRVRPSSFVHVIVEEGIGAGIVIDGRVLRGANYVAGEFGTLLYGDQSASIERLAGLHGLLEAGGAQTLDELVKRSQSARVQDAIRKAATILGFGLVAIINVVGPEVVTLGGAIIELIPAYYEIARSYTLDHVVEEARRNLVISRSALSVQGTTDSNARLVGIGHLALQFGRSFEVQAASSSA